MVTDCSTNGDPCSGTWTGVGGVVFAGGCWATLMQLSHRYRTIVMYISDAHRHLVVIQCHIMAHF